MMVNGGSSGSNGGSSNNTNMDNILPRELTSQTPRRGKWSVEEERYTEKIISKLFLTLYLLSSSIKKRNINNFHHLF